MTVVILFLLSNPDIKHLMNDQHPYTVIVMGLPGSGKTFLARQLAPVLGAAHISSDQVRDQYQLRGKYTLREKQRVYQHMLEQAAPHLQGGQSVLLDGTFHLRRFRQLVEDFTTAYDCRLFCIEVTADEDAIRQRTAKPRPNSEADYNVYKLLKQQYEPLQKPHLQLNSSKQSIDQMIQTARDYLLQ